MTSLTGGSGPMGRGPRGAGPGEFIPPGQRKGTMSNFTPEQHQLFGQMFSHVGPESYLSKLAQGDQSTFEQMEAPALRQFAGFQGDLASRFSGMGAGARRSSGFQNQSTAAAGNLAENLQSNRQNLQRQALMDLRGLSQELLGQRPYENFRYEKRAKKSSPWAGIAGAAVGGIGGAFFGNPIGGAQLGYGVGNAIGGGGGNAASGDFGSFGQFRNPFGGG